MKDILHKPNQLITCSSNNVSYTQRKLYNSLLMELESKLKNGDSESIAFNVEGLNKKLGLGNFTLENIKQDIEKLMSVTVKVIRDKERSWDIFNLVGQVSREDNSLIIYFPPFIRKAITQGNFYTTIDLKDLRLLKSKYSIIFYEWYKRYKGVEVPQLEISEFKNMMGISGIKSYDKSFTYLNDRVIKVFVKELREVHKLDIKLEKIKTGRSIKHLKFKVTTSELEPKGPKKTLQDNIKNRDDKIKEAATKRANTKHLEVEEKVNNKKVLSDLDVAKSKLCMKLLKENKLDDISKVSNITSIEELEEFKNKYL